MAAGTPQISLLDTQPHAPSTSAAPPARSVPLHSGLVTFQLGVGLPGAAAAAGSSVSGSNIGTYAAICSAEASARLSFYLYDYVLSFCVVGQIVLSAVLTSLGAANSNYTAIAALGALNTAVAATIALLKGQGLPNRPRQDWNAWRIVRDYVEDREREFAAGVLDDADADKEIQAVLDLYHQTMASVEKNRPDIYTALPAIDGRAPLDDNNEAARGVSHNF